MVTVVMVGGNADGNDRDDVMTVMLNTWVMV